MNRFLAGNLAVQLPTRSVVTIAASTTLLLGALLPAPAQARVAQQATGSAVTSLEARLTASGDANGSGHATVTLDAARRKVCATIHWAGIEEPEAAHVHRASDGSVVVDLTGAVTGAGRCTRGVARRVIADIVERPGRYYVNVHNAPYPAGAIQGKLRR